MTKRLLFAGIAMALSVAHAADYQPPGRFNGYQWGSKLSEFVGSDEAATIREAVELQRPTKLELVTVQSVSGAPGVATSLDVQCKQEGPTGECVRPELTQTIGGDGSHVLAQYTRMVDHNPYPGTHLFMTQYFFCARGAGNRSPESLAPSLEFCGALVIYQSEVDGPMENDDAVTNYDRILDILVERHGRPVSHVPRHQVRIFQDQQEVESYRTDPRRYSQHRWCGKGKGQLYPPCSVTITMTFDPAEGWGSVLYATHDVYAFAHAMHAASDRSYWLYVLLNDEKKLYFNRRNAQPTCAGTLLCRPTTRKLTPEERRTFQPQDTPEAENLK